MTLQLRRLKLRRPGKRPRHELPAFESPVVEAPPIDIDPDDPFLGYLEEAQGPVEMAKVDVDTPAVRALREAEVELVVPLISQGELIGMLNLGRRLSDQPYSTDDKRLLDSLAAQAAPAVRVAQLVRQQEAEAQERERMQQELRVAQLIQQTLLPKDTPKLPGWEIWAYYKPARAVGGDFYDFLELPDGQLGLVVGDVTDKGVPAALVMATCRTLLRAASQRLDSPGAVLERTNDILVDDIPPNMFVTCLYAILDPQAGRLVYANAGHNLPYLRTETGVVELRATGMPLGLMPGMSYEEKEAMVGPGESILLHSDGLVEAHDPTGRMFGFPRLMGLVGKHPGGAGLLDVLLGELTRFTGPEWEQEDDVTLVSIRRSGSAHLSDDRGLTLAEFSLSSEPGNERIAMERVAEAVAGLDLEERQLERLKTAVSETAMNAIEHGNRFDPTLPVRVQVTAFPSVLSVRVTDCGAGPDVPAPDTPDLEAKLAGEQSPRGWGLFLIKNMVDDLLVSANGDHHTVELIFRLKGAVDAGQSL